MGTNVEDILRPLPHVSLTVLKMSQAVAPAKKLIKKPKKRPSHPPFNDMIAESIEALAEKRGSSKIAIKKQILAEYRIEDTKANNTQINLALRRCVASGKLFRNRYHAGLFKNVKPGKGEKSAKDTPKKAKAKSGKTPTKKAKTLTKTPVKKVAKKTPIKKVVKP